MKNARTTLAAGILLTYVAVLLKLLIFKYPGVHFAPEYNFIPLKTILPYLTGYPTWIVARDNLLGNLILFMPLGVLVPLVFRQINWKYMLAAGFVVSLGIEVLQIVLHAGTFDIDDLLLNTLGAVLGYGVFIAFMRIAETSGIRYSWNMKKTWLTAIMVVAVLVGGFAVWKLQSPASTTPPVDKATLAQLQADMQGVTPHFVETGDDNRRTYTPAEQKIKDDLVTFLLAANPGGDKDYYSGLWLDAVGTRYVLASQPSAESSFDEVIDSQTGKVTPISAERAYYLASEGRDAVLYIGTQAIYTYTLDQGGVVLVSGSQLSGNETYHSGTSDAYFIPEQTHTKNSMTISVFDSSQLVQNPDALSQPTAMQTMNKKVRQATFSF